MTTNGTSQAVRTRPLTTKMRAAVVDRDWVKLPQAKGLADLGRPDGFHDRQVERWTNTFRFRVPPLRAIGHWPQKRSPFSARLPGSEGLAGTLPFLTLRLSFRLAYDPPSDLLLFSS